MFSDDVVSILVSKGLGVFGQTIFVGAKASLPDGPGPFITINVAGGQNPEGTHNAVLTPGYLRPGAQIVVRGIKYSEVEVMAAAAYAAFFPIRNQFVNGTWWRSVSMTQSEPFELGEDDDARPRLAFNFTCVKRPSPATS